MLIHKSRANCSHPCFGQEQQDSIARKDSTYHSSHSEHMLARIVRCNTSHTNASQNTTTHRCSTCFNQYDAAIPLRSLGAAAGSRRTNKSLGNGELPEADPVTEDDHRRRDRSGATAAIKVRRTHGISNQRSNGRTSEDDGQPVEVLVSRYPIHLHHLPHMAEYFVVQRARHREGR